MLWPRVMMEEAGVLDATAGEPTKNSKCTCINYCAGRSLVNCRHKVDFKIANLQGLQEQIGLRLELGKSVTT